MGLVFFFHKWVYFKDILRAATEFLLGFRNSTNKTNL